MSVEECVTSGGHGSGKVITEMLRCSREEHHHHQPSEQLITLASDVKKPPGWSITSECLTDSPSICWTSTAAPHRRETSSPGTRLTLNKGWINDDCASLSNNPASHQSIHYWCASAEQEVRHDECIHLQLLHQRRGTKDGSDKAAYRGCNQEEEPQHGGSRHSGVLRKQMDRRTQLNGVTSGSETHHGLRLNL